ncbi:hypothetical protein NE237_010467 [Protea cynaroides]|uniref:Uncharacterized protein n=1 Tax=Protea cynaroides TaxID=273540 RepID=A0A9Q0KZC8_9MAGN|nr:hypothetical protein NE237_010467 [Protea cynaroides]
MSVRVKVIYHYYGRSVEKWVDPDKYRYMDVVYDMYNSVLDHVKEGKNITFSVSSIPPEGKPNIAIKSDIDVVNILASSLEEDCFRLITFYVQVSPEYSKDYTVNKNPPSIAGRDGKSGIQSSEVPEWITPTSKYVGPASRVPKVAVRRGGFPQTRGTRGFPETGPGK